MSSVSTSRFALSPPARSERRVAVLQSNYIPWKGYFDIIADVDLFVFYDDVQYTKRDWRNRNQIKTRAGRRWLTVPVHASLGQSIGEVEIADTHWARKHWKTLCQSYSHAPYFHLYAAFLKEVYLDRKWTRLSHLNQHLIVSIARMLGIKTEFVESRVFDVEGKRLDRLLNLLGRVGATTYVSGPSGRNYIDEDRFRQEHIELVYKTYSGYPQYDQLYPPFEHSVSILDVLFHTGPDAAHYVSGRCAVRAPDMAGQALHGSPFSGR